MSERDRLLEQFAKARREVASWPQWMRDASKIATARLPDNDPSMIRLRRELRLLGETTQHGGA